MTIRNLARISATGLLAAGALAAAATPALAAEIDFGVNLKGTTIALGTSEKPATVSIANNGTSKPKKVGIIFDARQLNDKVTLDLGDPAAEDACKLESGVARCVVEDEAVPGAGATADLDLPLKVTDPDARGSAGKLTISIVVEGDTVEANNSKTAEIVLADKGGVDLRVIAFDVSKVDEDHAPTGQPLLPGERSTAWGFVANHGDTTAATLTYEIKLPKDVTFDMSRGVKTCDYNEAKTAVTCDMDHVNLVPWEEDASEEKFASSFLVGFPVIVSDKAKGPVTLTGGTWTAAGKAATPAVAKRKAATTLPEGARSLTKEEIAKLDVDASDNNDAFVAIVGGEVGGGAGGGEDDPSLPVTGPVAASAAGAGVLALGVGVFLFISARRRRISFAAPSDNE